jgi:hypothetical protein
MYFIKDYEGYVKSIFQAIDNYVSLPVADSIVLINPMKIPSFYAASVFGFDPRIDKNEIRIIFNSCLSS